MALLAVKQKSSKYDTAKHSFDFSSKIINIWTHTFSLLVSVLARLTFERQSRFQRN